jgi:uncharacterized protein (TIGR03067 family)
MGTLFSKPGRGLIPVGLLLLLVLAVPVRGDDATEVTGDLKRLQGDWVFQVEDREARWSLDGDNLRATHDDTVFVCKITLDPTANPRTINFFVKEGPADVVGKTTLGIYKIEDDRATFCVRRPGETNRPTEFKDIEDETFVFVIKRPK